MKFPESVARRIPSGHPETADDADGRVAVEPGFFLEPHDSKGGGNGNDEGRDQRQDIQEEPQGDAGKGHMGKPVSDHGVLPEDEENT